MYAGSMTRVWVVCDGSWRIREVLGAGFPSDRMAVKSGDGRSAFIEAFCELGFSEIKAGLYADLLGLTDDACVAVGGIGSADYVKVEVCDDGQQVLDVGSRQLM